VAALLLAGLVFALPGAHAADRPAGARELASATTYSGGVDFLPSVRYSQAILTVSGNGQTYRHELERGRQLSIGVFDPDGNLLADGTYSWQLQLVPTEAAAKRLRAAAAENGGRAPEPWAAQSGSFTIRGGFIADPAMAEAQERTATAHRRGAQSAALSASGFGGDRSAAQDDDAAVGSRAGVEAQVSAAARRQAPVAASSGLVQADRAAQDRSDAFTAAIGRSLEPAAASDDNQLSAPPRAPRPRSDGSNGRPRS
jgi:hypothetical protein